MILFYSEKGKEKQNEFYLIKTKAHASKKTKKGGVIFRHLEKV